jgi:hypothetical protein
LVSSLWFCYVCTGTERGSYRREGKRYQKTEKGKQARRADNDNGIDRQLHEGPARPMRFRQGQSNFSEILQEVLRLDQKDL